MAEAVIFNATELLLIASAAQLIFYAVGWLALFSTFRADRKTALGFLWFNTLIAIALLVAVTRGHYSNMLTHVLPDLLMLLGSVILVRGVHAFWKVNMPRIALIAAGVAALAAAFFGTLRVADDARVAASILGFSVLVGAAMWRTYEPTRHEFGPMSANALSGIVAVVLGSLFWRLYIVWFTNEPPNINQPSAGSELGMFAVLLAAFAPNMLYAYFFAARLVRRANRAARSDGLTGLLNHRAFMDRLDQLWSKRRPNRPLGAVLALDLDYFKRINDLFGHAMGDDVLRSFAQILRTSCPEECTVGRTGGEEFMVLAPLMRSDVDRLAQRVARRVKRARWTAPDGGVVRITVSIGIAFDVPEDVRVSDLLRRADNTLYEAKEGGRDRIVYADTGALDAPSSAHEAHPISGNDQSS